MVEAVTSATSSSALTQDNADVRLRARSLIVEGAQTGNLRAALKQVPKQLPEAARDPMARVSPEPGAKIEQGKPSPLDVKRRASSLMAEGARSGALRTALKQVSKPTPLVASNPSFEVRVQDVSASQQGAASGADPAEQIPMESPQPTPQSLSGTSLGMASMRGTPSSLAGTASTRATPSSSHVRSRSKELLLEGARTGDLQAALKQVPKQTSQATPNSNAGVLQGQPTSSDVKQRAQALMMEGAKTGNLRAALQQIPKGTQQVHGMRQAIPEVAPETVKLSQPTPSDVKHRAQALMMDGARTGNLRAALKQIPKGAQQVHGSHQAISEVAPEEVKPSASHTNVIQGQPAPSDVKQRAQALIKEGAKTGNLRSALKQIPKGSQQVHETSQAIPNVATDEGKPSVSHVRSRSKEVLLEGARTGNLQAALKQVPKQVPLATPNSQNQEHGAAAAEQSQPTPADVKQRAQALMMEGAKTGNLRTALKQIPKQTLQAVQEPDHVQNENTELKDVAERTVSAVVNLVVDPPETPMYDLDASPASASRQSSRHSEEASFEEARAVAAKAAATAAAGWIAVAMERATAAMAEAAERAVATTEETMAADMEGSPPQDSHIPQHDCASQDADDAALRCESAKTKSSTEMQQRTSSSQPKHESKAEELLLDNARAEPRDATEAWIKRVRQMLADESAAVPGRSLNSRKLSPRKVRKALGLPDLSGRSQFAGISDDGASSAFHMAQDGLETPPSPPAPSSDRSRYSAATPASPGSRSLRKSLSKSKLDMKIPEIPAVGLKKSSPPSSDGSRKAAAARENQSAVPALDMKKVHMGEDLDDIDANIENKSDRTGVACHGSTSNWDAGGSEDGTLPPSHREGDADDFDRGADDDPDATNLEVRLPSDGGSGTPSKAGSKDIGDVPAKLPELPPERSGAGPSPTAIALLGALHQQQADKNDWPGARPGAKAKASPKKIKSVFEIPLELPKKPKKPTPAELSSVRLSPMPGSRESKRSRSNGSRGRNSKATSKLTGSKSLPGLPAIWHLGVQKIVHSHFHHHYHVFTASEDAAPQADDGEEAEDGQQAEDGHPEEEIQEKNASKQPTDGVGMEF